MSKFHIGEEIQKEMRRQGLKPADFARALNRERQTVYDIFKKTHIATDTLTEICRVLNRDFFSDLSKANFDTKPDTEEAEDEAEIREAVSGLMPKDQLHRFAINYLLHEVIEEFLVCERRKPMVICCAKHKLGHDTDSLPSKCEQLFLLLHNEEYATHLCTPQPYDEHLDISEAIEGLTILILKDKNYTQAMAKAGEMARGGKSHVILFIPATSELKRGHLGGLVYEEIAEDLFEAWKDRAHFAVAMPLSYRMRKEYFLAYRREGIIDRLVEKLNKGDEINEQLFNLIFGLRTLEVEEISEEDSTGLSRIMISYTNSDEMSDEMREMMFNNGVNDSPRLNMWLDIRNGFLVDFQYNKRTQP